MVSALLLQIGGKKERIGTLMEKKKEFEIVLDLKFPGVKFTHWEEESQNTGVNSGRTAVIVLFFSLCRRERKSR